MTDTQITKIKRRLGIIDKEQDDLLTDLIEDAQSHFKFITKQETVNSKYDFMIREVAVTLYNRKGSEGMKSESVDGYSATYSESLFADYMDILNSDFNLTEEYRQRGKVKFL